MSPGQHVVAVQLVGDTAVVLALRQHVKYEPAQAVGPEQYE